MKLYLKNHTERYPVEQLQLQLFQALNWIPRLQVQHAAAILPPPIDFHQPQL